MVTHMSRIRQHYQDYILDLIRKIGVCDRMYVETGQKDYLDTYEMLKTEVEELKSTIIRMEKHNETYRDRSSEEKSTR